MANPKRNKSAGRSPVQMILIGIGIGIFLGLAFFGLDDFDFGTPALPTGGEAAQLRLIALDVGQGASTLVLAGDITMLVDSGERGSEELMDSYLAAYGVSAIDYFVITHPHSDHMGTAPHILDNYPIGELILPVMQGEVIPTTNLFRDFLDAVERNGVPGRSVMAGDRIDLSGPIAHVVAPVKEDYKDLNNVSVGLLIDCGDTRFLITGDAETAAERDMVESGRLGRVDVLFAGHHGSNTSSSSPFLAVTRPEVTIISCGADNRYGHPHPDALARLADIGAEVFRTDLDGTVEVYTDGATFSVEAVTGRYDMAA